MEIADKIKESIKQTLKKLDLPEVDFSVEPTESPEHGDYASNIALLSAKEAGQSPKEIALKIKDSIELGAELEKIEVAGPGFLNFFLKREFFTQTLSAITEAGIEYGRGDAFQNQKVLVEYTDPNPFKQLHIGHLMSNAIGESLSRLIEFQGAELRRANYQGDVGLHVAKAIWGMKQNIAKMPKEDALPSEKMAFLGEAYRAGAAAYEEKESDKTEIEKINTDIYNQSDSEINNLYEKGKRWSLDQFEVIYQKIGTKFDQYFFESEVAGLGKETVEQHIGDVFEKSDGAIVFRGEKFGLHTRVFLTSKGLPTYEAKELGLHLKKREWWDYDRSIVVTANEQKDVFAVSLRAFAQIDPAAAKKVEHVTHGMMLGPDGKKMSSRKGEVIPAEGLLDGVAIAADKKMVDRDFDRETGRTVAEQVAIGAIKYSILKQAPGKNIIFDLQQAVSFEGDSGPYLQYSVVRAASVLAKAAGENIQASVAEAPATIFGPERFLPRFKEVARRAALEHAPQQLTEYLISLAGAFNSFYGCEKIVDADDCYSPYKVALTGAVKTVLENGLALLAIPLPKQM